MPKAGKYTYPVKDIDECIDVLRKVYLKTKDSSVSREGFADAIGSSIKSSWPNLFIASLSQYGLVDTIDGNVVFTELGKKVISDDEQERQNATEKAVRKIQLFNDFGNKYGVDFSDDNLRHFLRDKAEVDTLKISEVSVDLRKILKKVVRYMRAVDMTTTPTSTDIPNEENVVSKILKQETSTDTESYGAASDYGIWVKKDPVAIDFCLNQIESIKAWLNYVKAKVTVTPSQGVTDDARGKGVKAT